MGGGVTLTRSLRLFPPPAWGTPRSLERETLGPEVGALAGLLPARPGARSRLVLLPHQQHIADVALELDPVTGQLVFDEVIVVGPRQVMGKTALGLPVMVHRALAFPGRDPDGAPQRILYTAQTADEARKKWHDHHLEALRRSSLRSLFTVRERLNFEAILWNNSSAHSPVSATGQTGGTGDQTDLGWVDEAWSHADSRIEQALQPTMLTRWEPQMWIVSMVPGPKRLRAHRAGFLRAKQAAGRAAVEAGVRSGTAYFEWSAPLLAGDGSTSRPGDPETWYACMPGLCPVGPPCRCAAAGAGWRHTTFRPSVARDFRKMALVDFCAEYLGWWEDESTAGWAVISEAEWEAARRGGEQMSGRVALGVWVPPDRSWTCIAAAGPRRSRGKLVEITGSRGRNEFDCRRGTGWVLPRLKDLDARQTPLVIVTNDRALKDQAELAGLVAVHRAQPGDVASASAMLFDGVAGADAAGRDVFHLGQPELAGAVQWAVKRTQGQGWVWDQAKPDQDVSPVGAVSLALWGLSTPRVHVERPVPAGRPRVRWMG
jgi:hypothetical protein